MLEDTRVTIVKAKESRLRIPEMKSPQKNRQLKLWITSFLFSIILHILIFNYFSGIIPNIIVSFRADSPGINFLSIPFIRNKVCVMAVHVFI
jgi:hypothetical protein